jgi:ADP-heptose:LPS heptosyltransferase
MSDRPKFLVVRFSSIGDIVLTTPLIRALREQIIPQPEIHFLTKKAYAEVLAHNPHIDRIHTIEKATAEVTNELKAIDFDYIIDLHRNVRSSMVKKALKMVDFTLDKQNFDKWLLVRFHYRRRPIRHIVHRYLEVLKPFGIVEDTSGLDFHIAPAAQTEVAREGLLQADKYIAVALGATHVGKRMPFEFLNELCSQSKLPVVLLGGKEDRAIGEALAANHPNRVIQAAGKLSIHGSAYLIQQAALLVTGDTGLMHIGAALGTRLITVWGCTSPELGMSAYRPHVESINVEPNGRKKRPCSKLGDRCQYGSKHRCIATLSVDAIMTLVQKV